MYIFYALRYDSVSYSICFWLIWNSVVGLWGLRSYHSTVHEYNFEEMFLLSYARFSVLRVGKVE
jgi:hypothetical protein